MLYDEEDMGGGQPSARKRGAGGGRPFDFVIEPTKRAGTIAGGTSPPIANQFIEPSFLPSMGSRKILRIEGSP